MSGYHFAKVIQIILGYICVEVNHNSFMKLQSISSGWELFFHTITAAFLISTIILLLTHSFSGKSDERIHNTIAAICIATASVCLLITINGNKENMLNNNFGEQSLVEKNLQRFGNYFNKVAGPSSVDKFTNKYKRAGVYDQYTLAGFIGLMNALFYSCSCSSKPKSNGQILAMTELPQNHVYNI